MVPSVTCVTRRPTSVRTAVVVGAVALAAGMLVAAPTAGAAVAHAKVERWSTTKDFEAGSAHGTRSANGALTVARPTGTTMYAGKGYEHAAWTSPWSKPGFGANQLIASWNARTPKGTLVKIAMQGRTTAGGTGSWDTVAHWAEGDGTIRRESAPRQVDDYSFVNVDTVVTDASVHYEAWKVRVTLMRAKGSKRTPSVRSIGAVASQVTSSVPATSRTTMRRGVELDVPHYSQMIHQGEYPQWDNGGEAWCSPTSTMMVLRYFGAGPARSDYAWVNDSYRNPFVDHAARHTFDYRYDGAGNWPFNTAYAATNPARDKGGSVQMDAFVTRLKSLRDAEKLIKAGIPVVASVTFGSGELSGAPISSTSGHLMVIAGFTAKGKVIAADPAGPDNGSVRRVYDRSQFERAWLRGGDGTSYVIRPKDVALPGGKGSSRW
ncbi:MAG: peptidase C39 family protein [Nocardioidaceae bacterium]